MEAQLAKSHLQKCKIQNLLCSYQLQPWSRMPFHLLFISNKSNIKTLLWIEQVRTPRSEKGSQNCSSSNGHLRLAPKASQSSQIPMLKCQTLSRNKHVYNLVQKAIWVSIAYLTLYNHCTGGECLYLILTQPSE